MFVCILQAFRYPALLANITLGRWSLLGTNIVTFARYFIIKMFYNTFVCLLQTFRYIGLLETIRLGP
jgi:hypothetical protein